MSDLAFRTSICSVVFVDIVDYSKAAVDRQVAMKADLNDAVREGVVNVADDELIVLDSGDGAAICFFGDPEDALFVATAIAGAVRGRLRLRTGINLGPVKIVTDLNGNRNVIGDAINVAQRIMSFADEHEVLISRPYFEVVSCLRDENTFRFQPLGVRKDKHIREHEIYAVASAADVSEPVLLIEAPDPEDLLPLDLLVPDPELSAEFVETCRAHLARFLGPMAAVMVRRIPADVLSRGDFVAFLAGKIESPSERRAFIDAVGRVDGPALPQRAVENVPAKPAPAMERVEPSADNPLDEVFVGKAVAQLALAIGPMARPLATRAAARASSAPAFLALLADHIEDEGARRRFLDTLTG